MKKKIIAGALAFGLIPLMGTADVSAKSLPNPDKVMKPAGWSCDAPYIACQPFSGGTGKVSFNYQGSSPGKIRVFVANDGSKSFKFTINYPNGNTLLSSTTLNAGKTFIQEFSVNQKGEYILKYDSGTGDSVDGFFRSVEI
ncbi:MULTISPECIES: hypothetical protein [Bacillus amyloliquefaciens group]|uniref:hypothetical protein n=1 Tax=Bacillus amyloliquefaciens group TaxID=1938374 RepID=UPI0005CDD313|nr:MULTISPECIES: hypothetical protein [Bacillus amyloliquefaciens group]APH35742.1 hypothetical protein BHE96_09170 [Bacillus subtilis]KJD59693.1 hypothetical protein UZ38_02205 [Bacillus amyloliquefaciens]MBO3650455.1 hypothetical protein [Bacillus amyloliquefaciens]MCJ2174224.1 hypothetical protein [Bacillus amyloliquefaciens]MCR4349117.1 hypothetical protein [Bacillus amyloliquefaciens]